MKIVIPDKIAIPEVWKQKIRELGTDIYEDLPSDKDAIIDRIKDAEVITANYIDIPAEIIDAVPKLRYIIAPAVGYEWIDVAHAQKKGITVLNCPGFNSQAVAEHAVTLMLAVCRHLVEAAQSLQDGEWQNHSYEGVEVFGKKMVLIGHGNIGQKIERIAKAMGIDVEYTNSKSSNQELEALLQTSDIVCIAAPLNEKTRHLLNRQRLALLKPSAIVVNVGRGAIIDQSALYEVLSQGKLYGAGLDVFENEPLTGVPDKNIVQLAKLPNVIATPHIAYNTENTTYNNGAAIYKNIQDCLADKPVNIVEV